MAKTQLVVSVEYDDAMTDPESLAAALDNVMKTAFTILGADILEEYGDPKFGEFQVTHE